MIDTLPGEAELYRPTFVSVAAPVHTMSTADRCSLTY